MIKYIYKIIRFLLIKISTIITQFLTVALFYLYNSKHDKGLKSKGIPILSIQGIFIVGRNFRINNSIRSNPIGRNYKCIFVVSESAKLKIGDDVGMSGTTIVCSHEITIGNNVKCGGNVCLYDTDFHSLNPNHRINPETDRRYSKNSAIIIHDNVFIGAHSTILKGVTIGENSIIGACSLVSKNIPSNEIWAGNPAKFIREQ